MRYAPTVIRIAGLWAQLALAWSAALLGPFWLLPPVFVVICACQQAMLLWVHEASHKNLARSGRWNDAWTDLLVATPVGMTVRALTDGSQRQRILEELKAGKVPEIYG